MADGEIDISDHEFFQNSNSSMNLQPSLSMDSFLDDLLKNSRTCTHTHTCNPPGPESAHTHTCYHTHTQVLASEDDTPHVRPKRPLGNREAVRKYREKKKAHTAYLEEEVRKLRLVNQQLVRKLQGQSVLEAEVSRLRGLLADLRGKIDSELRIFPQKRSDFSSTTVLKEAGCGDTSVCSSGKMVGFCEGNCEPAIVDCRTEMNGNTHEEASAGQAK